MKAASPEWASAAVMTFALNFAAAASLCEGAGNRRRLSAPDPFHGRALRGDLGPFVDRIVFHAAASCALLTDCHPRPVNASFLRDFAGLSG